MKLAPFALVFVLLAACGDDDKAQKDPCASVTCGDHATCTDGTCACDAGFDGDGTTCAQHDPCAGVICDAHATCASGACVCNTGFDGNGTTCTAHDPCSGVTCSAHATCSLGTCACDAGFTLAGANCVSIKACTSDTTETLANGVVGCAATLAFADRAICNAGWHVCSAADWRTAVSAGATAPAYHYWTADRLYYGGDVGGGEDGACWVTDDLNFGDASDCGDDEPMRVCAEVGNPGSEDHADALGNVCNWVGCGWETDSPDFHFGGCAGNGTAGALCCVDAS